MTYASVLAILFRIFLEFTRTQQHRNKRQKDLRKRVPDLHAFTYERLRELQDPRTMSREEFERQLALIPVFVVDPDCDRREPNKHYDPFCERDDPDSAAHLAPLSIFNKYEFGEPKD